MLSAKDEYSEDGAINKNGRLYNVQADDDDENETSNACRPTTNTPSSSAFEYRAVYLLLSLCYLRWTI